MTQRVVIADTETVTLDADTGLVWEIGLIDVATGAEYQWQVRPSLRGADPNSVRFSDYYQRCVIADRPAGKAMRMIHPGLTRGKRQATDAAKVAHEVAKLTAGAVLVGAVPDFDARMLRAFLHEHDESFAAHYHLQDVETLVYGYLLGARAHGATIPLPPLPLKSDDLSRAIGVNPDGYRRHEALEDCRWVKAQLDVVMDGAR